MSCVQCKKPATLICAGCKDAPVVEGDPGKPRYCNATCQKADWKEHKGICRSLNDRKTLYRVASTAQLLFYVCRELTWCEFYLENVEKVGEDLLLHATIHHDSAWSEDAKPFPAALVPIEEDRKSVLSFMQCIMATRFMHEFVVGMLGDIVSGTMDMHFYIKGQKRRTMLAPCPDAWRANTCNHDVLKVTLRSGEAYAIDLAGAQYGHYDPVTPWEKYERTQIEEIRGIGSNPAPSKIFALGDCSLLAIERSTEKLFGNKTLRPRFLDILQLFDRSILEWRHDQGITLSPLWKMPEETFKARQKHLVDYVEFRIQGEGIKRSYTVNGKRLMEEGKHVGPWWEQLMVGAGVRT